MITSLVTARHTPTTMACSRGLLLAAGTLLATAACVLATTSPSPGPGPPPLPVWRQWLQSFGHDTFEYV